MARGGQRNRILANDASTLGTSHLHRMEPALCQISEAQHGHRCERSACGWLLKNMGCNNHHNDSEWWRVVRIWGIWLASFVDCWCACWIGWNWQRQTYLECDTCVGSGKDEGLKAKLKEVDWWRGDDTALQKIVCGDAEMMGDDTNVWCVVTKAAGVGRGFRKGLICFAMMFDLDKFKRKQKTG